MFKKMFYNLVLEIIIQVWEDMIYPNAVELVNESPNKYDDKALKLLADVIEIVKKEIVEMSEE